MYDKQTKINDSTWQNKKQVLSFNYKQTQLKIHGGIKNDAVENNKGYTVRETERYIRTYFVDTKYNRIMLIEDKEDHDMDRIKIIRFGTKEKDADIIVVYRYDDPAFVESVINGFMK